MNKPSIILFVALWLTSFAVPAYAANSIRVNGEFTANVDFATLSLTPVGANCLLKVDGSLVFTGTLEGVAIGTTKALVFAPCEDVAVTPPGTFKDVFRSKLEFLGAVNGQPATADLTYFGVTEVGGQIKAKFLLKNGLNGVIKVDAIVAVGGSYRGFVKLD
ncbi:MAG: hypothetical protein WBO73_13895 [Gammaproteobacteria bacterium]|jgi:hypothetical protein